MDDFYKGHMALITKEGPCRMIFPSNISPSAHQKSAMPPSAWFRGELSYPSPFCCWSNGGLSGDRIWCIPIYHKVPAVKKQGFTQGTASRGSDGERMCFINIRFTYGFTQNKTFLLLGDYNSMGHRGNAPDKISKKSPLIDFTAMHVPYCIIFF